MTRDQESAQDARAGAAVSVLVVSADAAVRDAACRQLLEAGFTAAAAVDGASALAQLRTEPARLLIVDRALRDAAGEPFRDALAAGFGELPLLELCANQREVLLALESGAGDAVERPFAWPLVVVRARRLVQRFEDAAALARLRDECQRLRRTLEDERRTRRFLDHFDALTGLPDAQRLEHALENALIAAAEESQIALAIFEIEQLSALNSRLGRARMNTVLQQVAQRLSTTVRSEAVQRALLRPALAMPARMGPGLFAVLLTGLPGPEQARSAVRVVLDSLSGRYLVGDEEIVLAASVGVALAPADGLAADTLLQRAELAVSDAIAKGGAIRFHSQVGRHVAERSRAIARLLPKALERGELRLEYQPVVDAAGWRIAGAEALLRWRSPELGEVPPAEFVPIADESGLTLPIGGFVLRSASAELRAWLDEGLRPPHLSVNVSLCQLVRGGLADVVAAALAESRLDAGLIALELRERGVLRGDPDVLRELDAVRRLGVRLVVDGYGSGDCPAACLASFPVHGVKLDEALVRSACGSAEHVLGLTAAIAAAGSLGLSVSAAGVETRAQLALLATHGCTEFQGLLFSPPLPAQAFGTLLREDLPVPLEKRP